MNRRKIRKAIHRIIHLPRNKYLLAYMGNKARHFYLRFRKTTKVAWPSSIMLELTNHCNLHCTTCPREYDYGKEMDKGHMQTQLAKKAIDEAWPYLDSIGLTGMGETFLYKEIKEIVDYIKSKNKGIIISMSTNAMLPSFIEKVSDMINKVDTIQVSIDGLGQVYESIRINADFDRLDKNLRELSGLCKNSGTTLMLNMVVTRENHFQMSELVNYADEIGIEYMDFTMINLAAVTNIDVDYYDFYTSSEFLDSISSMEKAMALHKNVTVNYKNFSPEGGFQKCPFPWSHFYITWDGYLVPCCAKPFPKEMHFGNVTENKLIDILNSKDYRNFRKLWFDNVTPRFCNKCHFIGNEPVRKAKSVQVAN